MELFGRTVLSLLTKTCMCILEALINLSFFQYAQLIYEQPLWVWRPIRIVAHTQVLAGLQPE